MLSDLKKEFSKLSPLAAYGVVILAAIILYMIVENLNTRVQIKADAVEEAQVELITLDQLKASTVWEERLLVSEKIKTNAEKTVWSGPTEGVISATLEQYLRDVSGAENLRNLKVTTDPEPVTINDIDTISFEVSGAIPATLSPVKIVADLALSERRIFIKETSFTLSGGRSRLSSFSITGFVPISVTDSSAAVDSE